MDGGNGVDLLGPLLHQFLLLLAKSGALFRLLLSNSLFF